MPTVTCPECGTENDLSGFKPGEAAVCRACDHTIYAPKPRRRPAGDSRDEAPHGETASLGVGGVLRIVVWVLCGAAAAGISLLYFAAMRRPLSAIQEASIASQAAAWLVSVYVLARAADGVVRAAQGR